MPREKEIIDVEEVEGSGRSSLREEVERTRLKEVEGRLRAAEKKLEGVDLQKEARNNTLLAGGVILLGAAVVGVSAWLTGKVERPILIAVEAGNVPADQILESIDKLAK